jgi:G3E family GTPase
VSGDCPQPAAPIPVTVLTGFLGSGKTTLLARLLRHPELADTAVIVNEFGEIGLDHLLVEKGEENVVLLDSGCLCCTVSNSLAETLADLDFRAARGDIPPFRRAVIETTGLADPAPIIQMLMTHSLVRARYALDGVVATVDGVLGAAQLAAHEEALGQAALADRIVVTKGDLAAPAALGALRRRLAVLNPGARVSEAVQGGIDPAEIVDIGLFDIAHRSLAVARWLRDEALPHRLDEPHPQHERIHSFAVYLDRPADWAGYAAWVGALRNLRGPDLLRIKGLLAIEDAARPYVVQSVQHVFSPPLRLPGWPSPDRRSRLVFIVRDIEQASLEESLHLLGDP